MPASSFHARCTTQDIGKTVSFRPGLPVKAMLAKPTNGISEVLDKYHEQPFTVEYKYDGERAQVLPLATQLRVLRSCSYPLTQPGLASVCCVLYLCSFLTCCDQPCDLELCMRTRSCACEGYITASRRLAWRVRWPRGLNKVSADQWLSQRMLACLLPPGCHAHTQRHAGDQHV